MKKFILIFGVCLIPFWVYAQENNTSVEAANITQKIYAKCIQTYEDDQHTTSEMIELNTKINDCLIEAIEVEIKKGFSQKQQKKMLQYLNQIRKSVFELYHTLYTENVYCDDSCGSVSALYPYADEGRILSEILENLVYLNMKRNGY